MLRVSQVSFHGMMLMHAMMLLLLLLPVFVCCMHHRCPLLAEVCIRQHVAGIPCSHVFDKLWQRQQPSLIFRLAIMTLLLVHKDTCACNDDICMAISNVFVCLLGHPAISGCKVSLSRISHLEVAHACRAPVTNNHACSQRLI